MPLYNLSLSTPITDLKTALSTEGLLGTVHYENTSYLIFSTPAFPNIVLKVYSYNALLLWYYGTAYSTGTTLTNEVKFTDHGDGTGAISRVWIDGVKKIIAGFGESGAAIKHTFAIFTMSNGDIIGLGTCNSSASANYNECQIVNLTKGHPALLIASGFSYRNTHFTLPNGNLVSIDFILANGSAVYTNQDGTVATAPYAKLLGTVQPTDLTLQGDKVLLPLYRTSNYFASSNAFTLLIG